MSTPIEENELAREWRVDVNMGTEEVPDWQLCPGVREFQHTAPPNIEDSSDYDSDGWAGNTKTAQSWALEMTIRRKANKTVKVFHPVHEAIRLAADAYGEANLVHLRWYNREGLPEAYEGKAIPEWEPQGGEYTALGEVAVNFTGDGPRTTIDNPLAGS
ncbi:MULTISPECIES: phage tail tube protein [Streptomyces]|uniref:phage tail tube protein n=1 Tax=Streptomyces TaxID=1883 RepID=UPI000765AB89|nr:MULTISPECIES: hypothetical protein [Streptomyces]MBE4783906.1 hypothetical protein [Streptomyces caniscabiei]MBE4791595.1 hypothetical protein [Streptomyces caniscabiei]MDX3009168.1 hypothetical protein [Streptomyces caniscabiei]MDX3831397.1 hypothetical protein [Streptomyces europaeiscabiei]